LLDTDMIACVFSANQISKKLQLGFGGNAIVDELPAAIAERLGGNLDTVIASLGSVASLVEDTKIFTRI
jgi:hypothetical protein